MQIHSYSNVCFALPMLKAADSAKKAMAVGISSDSVHFRADDENKHPIVHYEQVVTLPNDGFFNKNTLLKPWFTIKRFFARLRHPERKLVLHKPTNPADIPLRNFFMVSRHIYRGGQPGIQGKDWSDPAYGFIDKDEMKDSMRWLRDTVGVRTMLDLRFPGDFPKQPDHIKWERETVEELNVEEEKKAKEDPSYQNLKKQMRFFSIPLDSGKPFDPERINQVVDILNQASISPVYVHCREGKDRTGTVLAIYRMFTQPQITYHMLLEEMQKAGHELEGMFMGIKFNLARQVRDNPRLQEYYGQHKSEIDEMIAWSERPSK